MRDPSSQEADGRNQLVSRLLAHQKSAMSRHVVKCLVGIVLEGTLEEPEPVGSGVLLGIEEERFLVTAAHVLDHRNQGPLHLTGSRGFVPLGGSVFDCRPPDGMTRNEDRFDFAFVRLDKQTVEELGDKVFLQPSNIDPNDVAGPSSFYFLAGFPLVDAISDFEEKWFRWGGSSLTTTAHSGGASELSLSDSTHLVVDFSRDDVRLEGVSEARLIPTGMSGGGVWRFASLPAASENMEANPLVAVIIESPIEIKDGILCTRISLVLEAIRDAFPSLSGSIPAARRVRVNLRRVADGQRG